MGSGEGDELEQDLSRVVQQAQSALGSDVKFKLSLSGRLHHTSNAMLQHGVNYKTKFNVYESHAYVCAVA